MQPEEEGDPRGSSCPTHRAQYSGSCLPDTRPCVAGNVYIHPTASIDSTAVVSAGGPCGAGGAVT